MKHIKNGIQPGTHTPHNTKQLATLTAKLALVGVSVFELASGGFLLSSCQWCSGRYCADMKQLEAMAEQMCATNDNAMRQGMAYQGTQQDGPPDFTDGCAFQQDTAWCSE
jgi:hypothetical protein